MSTLLERPRIAAVRCVALLTVVVVAMLAGQALAGNADCPAAGGAGSPQQPQR